MFISDKVKTFFGKEVMCALNDAIICAENLGVNIYLIGGVVRDILLNNPAKDIDITVETDAISFCKILEQKSDCKIISTQENLRTAKVCFYGKIEIDFASTRREKYDFPGKLPIAYDFGCPLCFDVPRRDFSINTLAIKLSSDNNFELEDYYLAKFDIDSKKIRILHHRSFIEDPSRIIRALKFKFRFGFDYENQTFFLMQLYLKNPDLDIPLERIKSELKQYFSINKSGLYEELINTNAYKLVTLNPVKTINENLFNDISKYGIFNKENKWLIYFSLLLVKDEKISERLNLTSEEKKIINETKLLINNPPKNNDFDIYKSFHDKHYLTLCTYYLITNDKKVLKFLEKLRNYKIEITGKDLIKLGYQPSSNFNKIFDEVLKEKIAGKLATKQDEICFVKSLS